MHPQMNVKLWAILLLTAGLFGSSFFFIKLTVDSIPPLTIAAGRTILAAVVVYLYMRSSGQRFPGFGSAWIALFILGILTAAVPYIAIAWGQQHIDSSLGGILFATIPIFSVLVAPVFLAEETFTAMRLLGALVGLTGVALIIGPEALAGIDTQMFGAAITLVAAFSYATGNIYARTQGHLSPVVMAAGQFLTASLVLVPLSLTIDAPLTLTYTQTAVASLIAVALFCTAIPSLLLFWLIRNAGATNASLLAFFMPIAAVILGVGILGEALSWLTLAGFSLIFLAAAIVTGKLAIRR